MNVLFALIIMKYVEQGGCSIVYFVERKMAAVEKCEDFSISVIVISLVQSCSYKK